MKPDAIRTPLTFAGSGSSHEKLSHLHSKFSEILGVEKLYVRHQGTEHFITGDPLDSMLHRSDSPNAGRERYDWKPVANSVYFGYRTNDA